MFSFDNFLRALEGLLFLRGRRVKGAASVRRTGWLPAGHFRDKGRGALTSVRPAGKEGKKQGHDLVCFYKKSKKTKNG